MAGLIRILFHKGRYVKGSDMNIVRNPIPVGSIHIHKTPLDREENVDDIIKQVYGEKLNLLNEANAYNYAVLNINGLPERNHSKVAFQFFRAEQKLETGVSDNRVLEIGSCGNYSDRERLIPIGNLIFAKHFNPYVSGQIEEMEHNCANEARNKLSLSKIKNLYYSGVDICQRKDEFLSKATAVHFFKI